MRRFEFHRVDIASHDLAPLLDGVDTVVHLAGIVEGTSDTAMLRHVDLDGTRRVLAAAGNGRRAAGSCRRRARRSTGPGPTIRCRITEAAALRPNPGFLPALHDAEKERRRRASGARSTRARGRRPCGSRRSSAPAPMASSRAPRSAVRRCRCAASIDSSRSCTSTTSPPRSRSAVRGDVDGACNVAADGWLAEDAVRDLVGAGGPALPDDLAASRAAARSGRAGWVTPRPSCCPTCATRGSSRATASVPQAGDPSTPTSRRSSRRRG